MHALEVFCALCTVFCALEVRSIKKNLQKARSWLSYFYMKNNALIVVDMQEKFLPTSWSVSPGYLKARELLITRVVNKVNEVFKAWWTVVNLRFKRDSPLVPELRWLLDQDHVMTLYKLYWGIFPDPVRKQALMIDNTVQTTYKFYRKDQYNDIVGKNTHEISPIQQILQHEQCSIIWVYTRQCVMQVFQDLLYIWNRESSKTKFQVLWDYSMDSHFLSTPPDDMQNTNELYKYYQLPQPIWWQLS